MSMCRVFSCVVGRGCLLWPVCSLGKTLLTFALLHSILCQICLLLQVFLDFLLLHSSPLWTSPDSQHQNQIDYILCSQRWRSSIQSAKTRPGADCGSDHELLIAKFRLKLKKVEKTTRPIQVWPKTNPYDYTMEVRNRFKGLDLRDKVPDELWKEVCDIVQETGIKTMPKKKKCKKAKWLSEEALQIAVKRREAKSKGEKERYKHLNAEFQRIARRD